MQIEPGANQYLLMLMDSGKLRKLDNAKVVFPGNAIQKCGICNFS